MFEGDPEGPIIEEWYKLLKSANYLGVTPWGLAGIPTDEAAVPRLWAIWAWAVLAAEAQIAAEKQARMTGF